MKAGWKLIEALVSFYSVSNQDNVRDMGWEAEGGWPLSKPMAHLHCAIQMVQFSVWVRRLPETKLLNEEPGWPWDVTGKRKEAC